MTEASEFSAEWMADLRRRLDRPIVLVGLMGSGKSTIGQRLAGMLGVAFADSDREIEKAAARTVAEIFAEFGEPYFRDGERRVIARLLESGSGVIATGGGAFVDAETRALVLERAIAVWLDADIETLVTRTARRDSRPLLKDGDPREILTRLHDLRAPHYAEAQIRIETNDLPHHLTAMTILEAVHQWL